ncbi:NYN domain-containing protein [Candidatus Pacearchaeota archaeon]|nr:NYN domain-containing protein [Candidatus Pacearchaeota archaeon]
MKNESCDERVVIFIDGSNLYHIVKKLVPEKKSNDFDFEKFVKYLIKDRKLVRVYYYNCPMDRRNGEEGYIKQQKFFDKIQKLPNFTFVLCRMQKNKSTNMYEAKEDDIHLAVDMVKLAYNDAYDSTILVSSDGDFVPAIQAVKEKGKNVENIGFENKFSYHLQQMCDKFVKLRKEVDEQFFN